jgi:hypothetical protein
LKRDAFLSEMAGTRPAMTLRFAKEQPGFQRLLEKIRSASSPRKWLFARDTVIG